MQESSESRILNGHSNPKVITLDLETTGLDWQRDKILLCGYRIDRKGDVLYDQDYLRQSLSNPLLVLSGHNIKFDALFLASAGFDVQCQLEDTRVLAYLNWPEAPDHSLKALVRERLSLQPTELSDIQFKPIKRDSPFLNREEYYKFADGKLCRKDLLLSYHAEDIRNVDRLRAILRESDWFNEVEMPLTRMLFEMEFYGCPLDPHGCDELLDRFSKQQARFMGLLKSVGISTKEGEAYNPNSAAHNAATLAKLGHNLEEVCEKSKKTGAYSIDKALLKSLAWKGDEFSKTLLEYRKYDKILTTYLRPFKEGALSDGRIHGSINQAGSEDAYGDGSQGTHTGRLSSSDPNLQNIPSRTKQGKEVRSLFVSSNSYAHMFVSDLSQIEPRLLTHYCQAPKLIHAYANDVDTHTMFARDIFGGDCGKGTVERFIGKSCSLATVYGCSYRKLLTICENFSDEPLLLALDAFYPAYDTLKADCGNKCKYGCKKHLRENVGLDARTIYAQWMFFKNVQDKFKAANPEIFNWRDTHIARTRRIGYVVTIGGRRIDISGLDSRNFKERAEAERRAVNYLIQGSAADIMKMIMIRFQNELVKKGLGRVFASVHDEVLGEIYDKKHVVLVKELMEGTISLRNVKIEADSKLVASWAEKS